MERKIGTSLSASDAYLVGGYMTVRPAKRAAWMSADLLPRRILSASHLSLARLARKALQL
jgi:hypothetical protein